MRLIDAHELIRKIRHEDKDGIYWEIYHAPTIEAEPIRHGHWDIFYNDNIPFAFKCSECGQLTIVATKFCPSCGCKMDLKEVEE